MDVARFEFDARANKTHHFGLISDAHIDSPGHDAESFNRDVSLIVSRNGRIFFNGDTFDGIMPTDRKRYSRGGDTFNSDAQINDRVQYIFEKLKPYADHIDYFGMGNHEVSIVKYNNCDPLALLVFLLNQVRSKTLTPIKRSGYVGFMQLSFKRSDKGVSSYTIYRDHGKGVGAPVTHGTINFNRLFTTFNCNLCWLGHLHYHTIDKNYMNVEVTNGGNIRKTRKIGVITPGYQKNFEERTYKDDEYYRLNFPEERFLTPTPTGCAVLTITMKSDDTLEADVQ